jgi:hypothetical protein
MSSLKNLTGRLLGLCVLAHAVAGCFRSNRECPTHGCQDNARGEQTERVRGPLRRRCQNRQL